MTIALVDLPVELLSHVVAFVSTAQALRDLSLTCRTLHAFVEHEGWKIFLRTRFPSYPPVDQPARLLAHSLTTLSRNWDRKAFVGRYLDPSGSIVSLNTGQPLTEWKRPRGQTMGFQPSLDSYEELSAGSAHGRREILVWSAGTDLLIRAKESGPATEKLWDQSSQAERQHYFDQYHHRSSWFTFKIPGAIEGRDDITCVNILRPPQRSAAPHPDAEQAILGTANGDLNLVTFTLDEVPAWRREIFNTDGRAVKATHVSSSENPLLAAAFSDSTLALYPVHKAADTIEPVSHLQDLPKNHASCRIWSTRFLSPETLAVGLGPSTEPVHVYGIAPSGFSKDPIRKFGIDGTAWGAMDRVDVDTDGEPRQSSVYPISPLPSSSDKDDPNVFLSGGYDGIVRVHDMRSPAAYQSCYWDPTDDGAVYALQIIARERLVVGSSRHSIVKFFDLRVAGGRAFHYAHVGAASESGCGHLPNGAHLDEDAEAGWHSRYGWNLFLNPRNQSRHHQRRNDRRSINSPVYALTSPSPFSPSLFAGVENNVVQLDFTSIADQHPDSMFQHSLVRMSKNRAISVQKSWNPRGDILNLAAYEQSVKGAMRLRVQAGVGKYEGSLNGWDERWRDSSDL
ncbi:F-box domain cyclin-like protein [Neofusicoccum parvum]|nr:F-box domain cyclin-like protein [Neofusicoccum parvum]